MYILFEVVVLAMLCVKKIFWGILIYIIIHNYYTIDKSNQEEMKNISDVA